MVKQEIRKIYVEKRQQLDPAQFLAQSKKMLHHFERLRLPLINVALSYYPIPGRNEFDVSACETVLLARHPATTIAWPRLQQGDQHMEAISLGHEPAWSTNRYGIPEPVNGIPVSPLHVDLVLVPLLAFDKKGYRVGYGKGYYDRYLSFCRPGVIRVGFSFFECLDEIEDINEFDVPLNYCITPMRVYEF